ncbi:DUF1656 domain-containing protein [Ruficoccus amylovorans]|uniref:Uncharacterized protein YtcA n=1 Tax=Ruficoccus amylovorans TaxID=1804625 RepID=A0A842HBZ2_9BACT|nr:DUF1656 domain-containing protein [Ruficoccus amylovorans]
MSSEVEIFGAYFPGWLLSAIAGIILAACTKMVLAKLGLHKQLVMPVLVYLCLAFLWAALCWMIFFD